VNKILNILGVCVWIFLASYRLGVSWKMGSLFPLFLALQSGMIAYFLATRSKPFKNSPIYQQIFAWFAVIDPWFLQIKGNCTSIFENLAFLGVLLTLWALLNLKRSFGIAPADRGLVVSGPYKYIRHPMYSGEMLTILGGALGCISVWNLFVVVATFLIFYMRIIWEERIIKGYNEYKRKVRFRLIPYVW